MRDVPGGLVLRPDRRKGLATLTVVVVVTVAIVAAILIGDAPTVFAPIVGAVFAVLIILGIVALVRSRIILTSHELVVQGMFTRKHRSRSRIAEVVRATIVVPRSGARDNLFVLDAQRNPLIRMSGGNYTRQDFDRLVNTLGVPCDGPSGSVTADQFAKAHPGLVGRAERHPYRIAYATAGIVVAAATAVVLVAIATAP